MQKNEVVLVGAGLAGSLLSIFLAKRGFQVKIYEKRPDMRIAGVESGRSINLALSQRGIEALKKVGISDEVLHLAIPMYGRMLHPKEGDSMAIPYGKDQTEYINSISRGGLTMALMNIAEQYPNVKFYFDENCENIDFEANTLTFKNKKTNQSQTITADAIISTDGAGSVVRQKMKQFGGFQENISFIEHGYKELEIPAGENNTFQIDKHSLHIWPRGSFMLIALPNLEGSFTVTLFLDNKGDEYSFESFNSPIKIQSFFRTYFPDALDLMPNLAYDFFQHPTGILGTVRCFPWSCKNTLLLGDSAHAIVPFYGQGMNASFEDCIILDNVLEEFLKESEEQMHWSDVFARYQLLRKKDTDAIADLALENFYEMRNGVADPVFQEMRKLEHLLENTFPEYHSKYSMVTFHPEIPYSEAKRKGNLQNEFLLDLCKRTDDIHQLNLNEVFEQLQQL